MQHPLGIDVKTGHVVLCRVVIGGVQQVISIVERELLDGVVCETVTQVDIQHQFRREGIEH